MRALLCTIILIFGLNHSPLAWGRKPPLPSKKIQLEKITEMETPFPGLGKLWIQKGEAYIYDKEFNPRLNGKLAQGTLAKAYTLYNLPLPPQTRITFYEAFPIYVEPPKNIRLLGTLFFASPDTKDDLAITAYGDPKNKTVDRITISGMLVGEEKLDGLRVQGRPARVKIACSVATCIKSEKKTPRILGGKLAEVTTIGNYKLPTGTLFELHYSEKKRLKSFGLKKGATLDGFPVAARDPKGRQVFVKMSQDKIGSFLLYEPFEYKGIEFKEGPLTRYYNGDIKGYPVKNQKFREGLVARENRELLIDARGNVRKATLAKNAKWGEIDLFEKDTVYLDTSEKTKQLAWVQRSEGKYFVVDTKGQLQRIRKSQIPSYYFSDPNKFAPTAPEVVQLKKPYKKGNLTFRAFTPLAFYKRSLSKRIVGYPVELQKFRFYDVEGKRHWFYASHKHPLRANANGWVTMATLAKDAKFFKLSLKKGDTLFYDSFHQIGRLVWIQRPNGEKMESYAVGLDGLLHSIRKEQIPAHYFKFPFKLVSD